MRQFEPLLESFLDAARPLVSVQGHGTLTKLTRRVLDWFTAEELDPVTCSVTDAVRYQAYLGDYRTEAGTPYCTGTIHNHLKAAKRFFAWLVQTEQRVSNPFAALRYPRLSEHLSTNVLTEAQMGKLLSSLATFDSLPNQAARLRRYRVHVVAEFLYATGLRIAEAASIPLSSLDLEARRVYLPSGKGGKPRTVFLSSYATGVVAHFLSHGLALVLGSYDRAGSDTLFATHREQLATVVNAELATVCNDCGLPVITSHGFRHSLGTHLLRAGCDMRHIQVILGHDSLASTQIYTRVDKDDLKRSVDQFHPRQWARAQVV